MAVTTRSLHGRRASPSCTDASRATRTPTFRQLSRYTLPYTHYTRRYYTEHPPLEGGFRVAGNRAASKGVQL